MGFIAEANDLLSRAADLFGCAMQDAAEISRWNALEDAVNAASPLVRAELVKRVALYFSDKGRSLRAWRAACVMDCILEPPTTGQK